MLQSISSDETCHWPRTVFPSKGHAFVTPVKARQYNQSCHPEVKPNPGAPSRISLDSLDYPTSTHDGMTWNHVWSHTFVWVAKSLSLPPSKQILCRRTLMLVHSTADLSWCLLCACEKLAMCACWISSSIFFPNSFQQAFSFFLSGTPRKAQVHFIKQGDLPFLSSFICFLVLPSTTTSMWKWNSTDTPQCVHLCVCFKKFKFAG